VKKFFAQLRPLERRLAFGVMVVLILALNYVFVWPHFSDWSRLKARLKQADDTLALYQKTIVEKSAAEAQLKQFENAGETIAPEDMAIDFLRTVQTQAGASGVGIVNMSPPRASTNDVFFVEQSYNVNIMGTDEQLVDFLYQLGEKASMVRVRNLELQPDGPRTHLNANIGLVATYQKSSAKNLKPSTAPAKSTRPHLSSSCF
jgi:Tfp pilus assembly protein PilO